MGPVPMILGSTPVEAHETILANGSKPSFSALERVITITAAAPSLIPDALPAVIVPSLEKAARVLIRKLVVLQLMSKGRLLYFGLIFRAFEMLRIIDKWFDIEHNKTVLLSGGESIVLRRLVPTDREMVREFFSKLSAESKYSRYFTHKEELTEEELQQCLGSDVNESYVIGAWEQDQSSSDKSLIGTASYVSLQNAENAAEFAIIVADDWQKKGIGKYLMREVLAGAEDSGINRIIVYFLPSNSGMRKLAQSMADDVSFKYDEGIVVADVNLEEEGVTCLFWQKKAEDIWDKTFQSVIDMSFLPFTVYMDLTEEHVGMMKKLSQYDHISDFEEWLDSIQREALLS
ncbi:Protein lysine acetyltransferase Pka [Nymphon striatum]|nr:Protein lysine acetyltransferase Pka [Nymphon striatum]